MEIQTESGELIPVSVLIVPSIAAPHPEFSVNCCPHYATPSVFKAYATSHI